MEIPKAKKEAQIKVYLQQAKAYFSQPPHRKLQLLAVGFYEKALALAPHRIGILLALAKTWYIFGDTDKAKMYCQRALTLDGTAIKAHFLQCWMQLSIIERHPNEWAAQWESYKRQLNDVYEMIKNGDESLKIEAVEAFQDSLPKAIAYAGETVLETQLIWGKIIHEALSVLGDSAYKLPLLGADEPIRVGFVSSNFSLHSDWKMLLSGWMTQLDSSRFQLFGYALKYAEDEATAQAATLCTRFVQEEYSFEQWQETILADRPHVLIYPSIGLDRLTTLLAGLRLAPVQCTSWGNPITSGLTTMDYFLSSELAEPKEGNNHYSEKVVRLPFLSTHYRPLARKIASLSYTDFGLNPNAVCYLCTQPFIKYPAQYDTVFARIASQVTNSQFVFFNHNFPLSIINRFKNRLKTAFQAYDLEVEKHVVILERQSASRYHALAKLADVFLDSFFFSGGTSTMETAINHDIPVVTLPGRFMRGRQSYAMLKGLTMTETIASSLAGYVEIAVRLGMDVSWREAIAKKIKDNKQLLYQDHRCIAGLEEFLAQSVDRAIKGLPTRQWP